MRLRSWPPRFLRSSDIFVSCGVTLASGNPHAGPRANATALDRRDTQSPDHFAGDFQVRGLDRRPRNDHIGVALVGATKHEPFRQAVLEDAHHRPAHVFDDVGSFTGPRYPPPVYEKDIPVIDSRRHVVAWHDHRL